jgi:hypothetical protein
MRAKEFINEIGGSEKSAQAGLRRSQWLNEPLGMTKVVIQGYQVEFKPNGLYIYKDGNLAYKKAGDYSEPKNKNLHGAKKLVNGLMQQAHPDPTHTGRKLFGPEPVHYKEHRKKWQQAATYATHHKISFDQAWNKLFPEVN